MTTLQVVSTIVIFLGGITAISYVAADYIGKKYLVHGKDRQY